MVRMIVLAEVEQALPLAELLPRIPSALAPVLLDSSDGAGWSMLAWSPDRILTGAVEPQNEGGKPAANSAMTSPWPLSSTNPAALLDHASAGENWSCEIKSPLFGGWLGWFGFACGHAFESFPWVESEPLGFPDYHFGRYRQCVVQNPAGKMWLLWGACEATQDAQVWSDERAQVLQQFSDWQFGLKAEQEVPCRPSVSSRLEPEIAPLAFQQGVAQIRDWIGRGEFFQANYSHHMSGPAPADPRAFYGQLRAQQPVAFSAYWEDGEGRALLSCSPELFLSIQGNRLETRPIKGTAARGDSPESDLAAREFLEQSEKEIAELTMIVDMARHDLGRVALPGKIEVISVGAVEAYSTLFHRTARIRAMWNPSDGLASLMRATFPPASVTGAPKVRALQAIAELEQQNRGPYCGALGYWLPGDEPKGAFSVLIRTALIANNRLGLRVGAGIVWDSDPIDEWEETLLKARYLTKR